MDFLHVCLVSTYVFLYLMGQFITTIGLRVELRHETLLVVHIVQFCFRVLLALHGMAFKLKSYSINNKLSVLEY